MKTTIFNSVRTLCLAGLLAVPSAVTALPLEMKDAYYLGYIQDAMDLSTSAEVGILNGFSTVPAKKSGTVIVNLLEGLITIGADVNREGSDYVGSFPTALEDEAWKTAENLNEELEIGTGYGYVLAQFVKQEGRKSSARTLAWLVPATVESISLPDNYNGQKGWSLSHATFYRVDRGGSNVPDGGATLVLLGSVMAAFAALRRKLV